MKKVIFTLAIIFVTMFQVHSQIQNDTLSINNNQFELNGKVIMYNQVFALMNGNPEALSAMQRIKSNNFASSIFAYSGGFLIGYPLGQAIGGGKPQWELAGIGAGLVLLAIPFSVAAHNNARIAVRLYNAKVIQTASVRTKIDIGLTNNGLGIRFSF
jgi:hypothetical protein